LFVILKNAKELWLRFGAFGIEDAELDKLYHLTRSVYQKAIGSVLFFIFVFFKVVGGDLVSDGS